MKWKCQPSLHVISRIPILLVLGTLKPNFVVISTEGSQLEVINDSPYILHTRRGRCKQHQMPLGLLGLKAQISPFKLGLCTSPPIKYRSPIGWQRLLHSSPRCLLNTYLLDLSSSQTLNHYQDITSRWLKMILMESISQANEHGELTASSPPHTYWCGSLANDSYQQKLFLTLIWPVRNTGYN